MSVRSLLCLSLQFPRINSNFMCSANHARCSPCRWCVPDPPPYASATRCRACCITWPLGLGVCVALSAVTGLGESGELGSESPSEEEKYPLEARRGRWNIVLVWNTPRPSKEVIGILRQDGESGSPTPLRLCSPLSEREVCARAPTVPADERTPLSSVALTAVEESDRIGGLLDEQSVTVSLGFHYGKHPYRGAAAVLDMERSAQPRQQWAFFSSILREF